MSQSRALISAIILLSTLCQAQSPLEEIWKGTRTQSATSLSTDKITAGLREALKVSTNKAVALTGRPDGFLKNEAIRILLPDKMRSAARGLRLIGMGPQLDELEVGMNRAAEQAAPEAKQIFLNALMSMSIDDARHILTGNETAATDYFRNKTTDELTSAFAPIVSRSLQNVGVVRQYQQVMRNSMAAALLQNQNFDLDRYVVGKTLDGLFYMLGQQEIQIRRDPAARTSTLLKEVFGAQSRSR